jgi:hypothetical protein
MAMSGWLGILGALGVFVLPLLLAWWLLARRDCTGRRPRKDASTHEKMPR